MMLFVAFSVFSLSSMIFFSSVNSTSQDFSAYFDHHKYLDAGNTFSMYWTTLNETHIEIGVDAPCTGWAALGISPNGGMLNSDIAMFWVDDTTGTVYLQDRHTTGSRAAPAYDTAQNLVLLDGAQVNGRTMVRFIRAILPCDEIDDADLAQEASTTRMIYAYQDIDPVITNDDPSQASFEYHGNTNRGSQSLNIFSPGDKVIPLEPDSMTFDLTVVNYSIQNITTEYHPSWYILPVGTTPKHIIKWEPIISANTLANVHHILLFKCPRLSDLYIPSYANCSAGVYVWTIGGGSLSFPSNVGYRMSNDDSDIKYIRMDIHYDNPTASSTLIDNSGVRITYTSTLRQHNAGLLWIGLSVSSLQMIPNNMSWALNSGVCMKECTTAGIESTGVTVISSLLHAHNIAVSLNLRHIRDGVELPPIDSNWQYDSDYQQMIDVQDKNVQIFPGDELVVECFYDSTMLQYMTMGGIATTEEMCIAFLYVYPEPMLEKCVTDFESSQIDAWLSDAHAAGYLTGNSTGSGSGPGMVYHNDISGADTFYTDLWDSVDRVQICSDQSGMDVLSETNPVLQRQTNFTVYQEPPEDVCRSVTGVTLVTPGSTSMARHSYATWTLIAFMITRFVAAAFGLLHAIA